jgi:anti-sigma regulatory factor (Ser/Thr protein kinase)
MASATTRRMTFAPRPESVRRVRLFVERVLRDWHIASPASVLVASELATNAVVHARTDFVVSLVRTQANVRVEVRDADLHEPTPERAADDATSGRGLTVVEALASAWGVRPAPGGKTVWADVAEMLGEVEGGPTSMFEVPRMKIFTTFVASRNQN